MASQLLGPANGDFDLAMVRSLLLGLVALVELVDDEDDEQRQPNKAALIQALSHFLQATQQDAIQLMRRHSVIAWDHICARNCVEADYLGPHPLFNDRQFERIF